MKPPYGVLYRQPASRGAKRQTDPLHPLVDGGIVTVFWNKLEPRSGVYNLGLAHELLQPWADAGKWAQLSVHPYAKPDDVPSWWVDDGFELIDEDSLVAWTPAAHNRWRLLLGTLHDDGIPLAHTCGHLGHGAVTTEGGSAELAYEKGWTLRGWLEHADVMAGTGAVYEFGRLLLRDPRQDNYRQAVRDIATQAANDGAVPIPLIYDADRDKLQKDAEMFLSGWEECGIGDDWPLWVRASRRNEVSTLGRDHLALRRNLRWLMREGYRLRWMVIGHEELDGATRGDALYEAAWQGELARLRNHLIAGEWP